MKLSGLRVDCVVVAASCFLCCFVECARHGQGANIALVNAIGSMAATSGVYWSYLPPTLTSVSPTVVSPLGGAVVTIEGSNFGMAVPANAVGIGGRPCSIVVRVLCRHLYLPMVHPRVTPHSVRAACSAQVPPCCVCVCRAQWYVSTCLNTHCPVNPTMCFVFECVSVLLHVCLFDCSPGPTVKSGVARLCVSWPQPRSG
jgi:hypothetical protein